MNKFIILGLSLVMSAFVYIEANERITPVLKNRGFVGNLEKPQFDVNLGSVYARNEARTIQIVHVDVPGFRFGDGGIEPFIKDKLHE